MIKVNTAIANAERQLKDEMAKVVEGVQNDYRAAQTKEQGLVAALEEQKREVLELNQKSIGYSALQRDAASTQQMFEAVRQRVKETELSGELQSNNAKILDAAEVPRGPIWPRAQLNLLIALFGGAFLAVGLAIGVEYLNPRLAKPGDIADALGLPLLGIAPQVPGLKNQPVDPGRSAAVIPRIVPRASGRRIFLSPIAADRAEHGRDQHQSRRRQDDGRQQSGGVDGDGRPAGAADRRRPASAAAASHLQHPALAGAVGRDGGQDQAERDVARVGGSGTVHPGGRRRRGEPDRPARQRTAPSSDQRIQPGLRCRRAGLPAGDGASPMRRSSANAASSVLFVVGSGATSREAAQVALDRLASVQVQVVGVVLNRAKVDLQSAYGYAV